MNIFDFFSYLVLCRTDKHVSLLQFLEESQVTNNRYLHLQMCRFLNIDYVIEDSSIMESFTGMSFLKALLINWDPRGGEPSLTRDALH